MSTPPQGRLNGSFQQLMAAGCIQAEVPGLELLFKGLMILTHGNPCDGCPVFQDIGPGCPAFQRYNTVYCRDLATRQQTAKDATTPHNVPSTHPLAGLSVKQIAEKLGVSLGEVRRRKAAGTL